LPDSAIIEVSRSRLLTEALRFVVSTVRADMLALDLTEANTGPKWSEAVEATSRALIDALGELTRSGDVRPAVLIIKLDENPSPTANAAAYAAKGVVGTAALEAAPHRRRINTIQVSDATTARDIAAAVHYLSDDDAAGFTTGATINLTIPAASFAASQDRSGSGAVLVTGAAGGLGGATARALARAGREVVLTDLASERLSAVASELGALAVACNLVSASDVQQLAAHERLQDLSALVVQHGVSGTGAIGNIDPAERDRSLAVNGTAVHQLATAFLPALSVNTPGSMVVLVSQSGLIAERGNAAYCAAKFAAVGYVESLADAVSSTGVRVQALCPGPVDTPLMRKAFAGMAKAAGATFDDYFNSRMAEIPLGRFGVPEQIASATEFLCGLNSTGVVLATTGGVVLT
jgi:NAD(P)-dependent dehydrogenase (short-subunit alcohol dehydrogenase family)